MSNQLPKADVVIVGLGAAGGIAAHVLTDAGISVVAIEAGPRLDNEDFLANDDEISGGIRNWTGSPKFNHEIPTWRPDASSPTGPPPLPPGRMANMVGGSSVHYATQQWRFRADDFTIRSDTIARYGEDAKPEGSTITDWPISYDDLEQYYDQVEYLIGVSGEAGSNPFESPRSRPYPLPPLRRFGFGEMAAEGMSALGYNPFPEPSAIISEDYDGRPACTYCGFCSPYGCWNDSKSSTLVTAIPKAEATGRLEIRPNCRVTRIQSNDQGQVTGVEYLDGDGNMQEQPAGVVVLSSYAFENNRLLLLSTSDFYTNGLANNGGNVGKHHMSHVYVGSYGLFPGMQLNLFSGTVGQGTVIDDLNGDNFDHTDLGFIRGAMVEVFNNTSLPIAQSRTLAPGVPTWGSAYKQWLHDNGNSVGQLFGQVESLPYETNFLDLDPEVTDSLGMPVIRVTYSIGENEVKAQQYISDKLDELLVAMGATETWSAIPLGVTQPMNTHDYGGTRMGDDPESSVVNKFGLAHEVGNLCVLGGSTFVSTTGYNPTHTIEALAWYAAEHIAQNFNDIAV